MRSQLNAANTIKTSSSNDQKNDAPSSGGVKKANSLSNVKASDSSGSDSGDVRRQFVILSLDGGGLRGVVSLLILEELQRRVAALLCARGKLASDREAQFALVDLFDLVGGTSAGGITALTLAWRRLPISRVLKHCADLSNVVFEERRYATSLGKAVRQAFYPQWQVPLYRHEPLESALRLILGPERLRDASDASLLASPRARSPAPAADTTKRPLRVFVTTQAVRGRRTRELRLIRSYPKPPYHGGRLVVDDIEIEAGDGCNGCTAWEAARATSAGQTYFAPIQIGTRLFEDGGFGCNNPAMEAWFEAQAINDYDPSVSYLLLSVGTGDAPDSSQGFIFETLAAQLTTATVVDRQMVRVAAHPKNRLTYYRMSPQLSREIALDNVEEEAANELRTTTRSWIANNGKLLDEVAQILCLGAKKT